MLSVEISTIYKRDDRTRKVHHLIYLPDLDAVARFNTALGRIGNLGSDGRPILGLDSRDLLEITLEASPDGYLVPGAHLDAVVLRARLQVRLRRDRRLLRRPGRPHLRGGDRPLLRPGDELAGLQPRPLPAGLQLRRALARRRWPARPPSSPPTLDYFAVRTALRTGDGLAGTLEFFPEEGKYHADGHRLCGVNWAPAQTRQAGGLCPECGKPLTVGVLSRVEDLADRPEGHTPAGAHAGSPT